MTRRFIFPLKVMMWETLETADGQKIKPGNKMRAIGYIPVYESISEMVDDHGAEINSGTFEEESDDTTADRNSH